MIDYTRFHAIITYLYEQEQFVDKFRNLLYEYDRREFVDPYCFNDNLLQEYLIDVLENMFNDDSHLIRYYIYELDFGADWRKNMVLDNDGNDIKLQTIKDLWDALQRNIDDNI